MNKSTFKLRFPLRLSLTSTLTKEIAVVFAIFIFWRLLTILFAHLSTLYVPFSKNFLGGGLENYSNNPIFWSLANFDGEHYLAIAERGYGTFEEAFFPLFPQLIRLLGGITGRNLPGLAISGIVAANLLFFFALLGLYKLVSLDYSRKTSLLLLITLVIFPTSFFFGSVYTESLFLVLVVWFFYFYRKGNFLMAGLLGALASATRFIGIFLLPAVLVELLLERRKIKDVIWVFLIPLGLLIYMFYLQQIKGDALAFLHSLPSYGEQRSSVPILLPQVFFRYLFKILPNLNYDYLPIVLTTYLELGAGILFSILTVIGVFKLRISYSLYLLFGFLVPTLSGSFSSLPRYVLVLFPGFLLITKWIEKGKSRKFVVFLLMFILLAICTGFFSRGIWVS